MSDSCKMLSSNQWTPYCLHLNQSHVRHIFFLLALRWF
jgi:hypothetical protein